MELTVTVTDIPFTVTYHRSDGGGVAPPPISMVARRLGIPVPRGLGARPFDTANGSVLLSRALDAGLSQQDVARATLDLLCGTTGRLYLTSEATVVAVAEGHAPLVALPPLSVEGMVRLQVGSRVFRLYPESGAEELEAGYRASLEARVAIIERLANVAVDQSRRDYEEQLAGIRGVAPMPIVRAGELLSQPSVRMGSEDGGNYFFIVGANITVSSVQKNYCVWRLVTPRRDYAPYLEMRFTRDWWLEYVRLVNEEGLYLSHPHAHSSSVLCLGNMGPISLSPGQGGLIRQVVETATKVTDILVTVNIDSLVDRWCVRPPYADILLAAQSDATLSEIASRERGGWFA